MYLSTCFKTAIAISISTDARGMLVPTSSSCIPQTAVCARFEGGVLLKHNFFKNNHHHNQNCLDLFSMILGKAEEITNLAKHNCCLLSDPKSVHINSNRIYTLKVPVQIYYFRKTYQIALCKPLSVYSRNGANISTKTSA